MFKMIARHPLASWGWGYFVTAGVGAAVYVGLDALPAVPVEVAALLGLLAAWVWGSIYPYVVRFGHIERARH